MTDLPTHDDTGRIVIKLYEDYVARCPECGVEIAVELGDPYEGAHHRCVDCDVQLERVPDPETVGWDAVDPDAYREGTDYD